MQWRLTKMTVIAVVLLVIGSVWLVLLSGGDSSHSSPGLGAGALPSTCSSNVTRDTIYLGAPAWQGNLAADGFLFSLPGAPSAGEVATSFVDRAVVGGGCEEQILALNESLLGGGRTAVAVKIIPPAAREDLRLRVETAARENVVGITAVHGVTPFDVAASGETPVLRLLGPAPLGAERVTIRFRKGEDVWEVSASNDNSEIDLTVPPAEMDRYPDTSPQWVLFSVVDSEGALLDVGGSLVPVCVEQDTCTSRHSIPLAISQRGP